MGKIEYLNGKSDEFTFNASILYSRLLNTILEINTHSSLFLMISQRYRSLNKETEFLPQPLIFESISHFKSL